MDTVRYIWRRWGGKDTLVIQGNDQDTDFRRSAMEIKRFLDDVVPVGTVKWLVRLLTDDPEYKLAKQ